MDKASILSSPWVVVPTYNEIDNIEKLIRHLFRLPIDNLSVLIVDDNSPDGTNQTVKDLQKEFPNLNLKTREQKSGLGRAYIAGFQHALENSATAIVQMDADFSHDPDSIPELLNGLENNDLILGSRYVKGISVINWPLKRLLISMAGNIYASIVTGLPFKDATGGFRAWRAQALHDVNLATVNADGYGFQVATVYRLWKKEKNIKEIPIIFTERREGQSKMSKAIVFEAIILMWKLRLFDH